MEGLLSGVHFIKLSACPNMRDLITSKVSFSRLYRCFLSSVMRLGAQLFQLLRSSVKAAEQFVCSAHTLSASSYLWQVVWHLKSPPAGPLHWQPAAQRGEGFLGIVDKWLFSRAVFITLTIHGLIFTHRNISHFTTFTRTNVWNSCFTSLHPFFFYF